MTSVEAAAYLKVARQTLAVWRLSGRGPTYVKLGRKIAYDKAVLDAYVTSHTYSSTTEY
jgi:hypothetical protein